MLSCFCPPSCGCKRSEHSARSHGRVVYISSRCVQDRVSDGGGGWNNGRLSDAAYPCCGGVFECDGNKLRHFHRTRKLVLLHIWVHHSARDLAHVAVLKKGHSDALDDAPV